LFKAETIEGTKVREIISEFEKKEGIPTKLVNHKESLKDELLDKDQDQDDEIRDK